jgi:hypothetical protein
LKVVEDTQYVPKIIVQIDGVTHSRKQTAASKEESQIPGKNALNLTAIPNQIRIEVQGQTSSQFSPRANLP